MDLSPDDQARIMVLCMQARAYSELLHDVRVDIKKLRAAIRNTLAPMRRARDPHVRKLAEDMQSYLDETEPALDKTLA